MVISDVITYKNKIMNKLCSIPDVVTLINNPKITQSNANDMKDINIFSRMKIPNATLEVKNYICFDFNSKTYSRNEVLKNVIINIAVICHESDIKTVWGNRHDVLGGVIIDVFNWSDFLGFELELVSDNENILENNYYVRTLKFQNLSPNSLSNGVKMDGF